MSASNALLAAAGLIAALSIPLIFRMVPRNFFYGLRTPSTLSSDELWFRANHFAGWALLVAGAVSAILMIGFPEGAGLGPGFGGIVLGSSVVIALAVSLAYVRAIGKQ